MSRNFITCICDAEKEEESLSVSEDEAIESFTLEQRSCDLEEDSLKGKAQTDDYRNQCLQSQVSKANSNSKSCINPKESCFEFQNLLTTINSSGLQTELFRETLAKEHWKNLYFQSQAWLLKVYSLWKNVRKELQENIGYLAVDSASDNDSNFALKREINILSLVLNELRVQAEFLQQQENRAQNQLIPRDAFSVALEKNKCKHYMLPEDESNDHYVPKVQKPSVSLEIHSSGSKQKEIYIRKAQTSKDTNYEAADTEYVARCFSVKENVDETLELEDTACELRQRLSLEEKHNRPQILDTQTFVVPEDETNQAFLLLERQCDHSLGLVKETAKKNYFKRQYVKSQAELYKIFSKLEKFNICFEKKVTEFENVSLACINLQKEISKVKAEKEHYIDQFLQFYVELLRVHSMWQDLKTELKNKMPEFENQYFGSNIDRLSSALEELLIQLEASRQNIDPSQYSDMANKQPEKGTFTAQLEQSEHKSHAFLDSEDNQYDDSVEQGLNVSVRQIVSDSPEDKTFSVQENVGQKFEENMTMSESSSSSGEDSFEKVDETIKFVYKPEEKQYKLVHPKDRFPEETDYDKKRLPMIWEEEYEVSDTTESEPEQTSALEVKLLEQRQYTQQSQGSERLCVPDEDKQKVYHLEAKLSNEMVEKHYYKKLYNKSQDVVMQLYVEVDKYNMQYRDKSPVPESSSSSRKDDNDDNGDADDDDENAEDSIKGVWKSVAKLDFQVQTIKQLVEKFRDVPDPKKVFCIKDSSEQIDLKDTFDAPQPAQLDTTAPQRDQELITKLGFLQQRICDLEAELSKEKDQRNHYNKLYNELEAKLQKLHTALDKMNHKSEDRTSVSDTASSSGSHGYDYVDKNLKPALKSECIEDIKKLEKPNETNTKDAFPLPSDQNVTNSTFLDANQGELDLPNLQQPNDKIEITIIESVPEDITFAKQKELEYIIPEDHRVCITKAEIIRLHSLQQGKRGFDEELLKEKDGKDYYKKLFDETQPELLELRALRDKLLWKSEEMAKTADACIYMFVNPDHSEVAVPILRDSNVIEETDAPQPAQLQTSAATSEGSRYTRYISLNSNSQHSGSSLNITAPECDQEEPSTLGCGPLRGTQDTESSKESEGLSELEAERNKVFSLHQRVSALESKLSEEKDQKYYYSNLSNELRAELLKLRAVLEGNDQKYNHKTSVTYTSSSSEYDSNDYEDENIKDMWRFAGELEYKVQNLSELSKEMKKLAEPGEANRSSIFSLETDQNVQPSTALDAEHEDQDVRTTEAEITELLFIKQRNDDLEEELLKEQDEKDYYKKLYDEEHSELLELRAMRDNFLLKSEEMAKTADARMIVEEPEETISNEIICSDVEHKEYTSYTCMIVEELKETISNERISPDIEHIEYTSYTFLVTENDDLYVPTLMDPSVAMETHAPQPTQLETFASTTEERRGTRYASLDPNFQNSITSLNVTVPECDREQISPLGGGPLKGTQDTERRKESQSLYRPQAEMRDLYQKVSDLDTEVSREREQKDYYHKLYNESQVELRKLRAMLDKTAVPDTSSSSGESDNENIKDTWKFADKLECEVQTLSELTEKIKKLAEPHKTNLKGRFSLESDQSARSSTFLDVKQDDHDVPNLQHPSDTMETTVPESVPDCNWCDNFFSTPKKFEDTKSEEFTISEEEKYRMSLDVEALESDQEQISTSEVDVLQQTQDIEERNEEVTQLSSERQSFCDLEVDVLANASSTDSDNAEFLHLPSDVLQLQIDLSEQPDTISNQATPTEVIPSATPVISIQDFADSDLGTADENQTMKVSLEVTTPECEQVEVSDSTPVREQHKQNQDTFFTTDRDTAVQTIIPEEETAVFEAENRGIIRPSFLHGQFQDLSETPEVTESTSLDVSFSETEEDLFNHYEQQHHTSSHSHSLTLPLERRSSSEELRQEDRVQENLQVRRRTTMAHLEEEPAGSTHRAENRVFSFVRRHLPFVWDSSAYFIKQIVLTLAFSVLGAYICHEYLFARPHFDVNYGLFKILEPFCTFENVLPVPF